jgi:hypothetical protein
VQGDELVDELGLEEVALKTDHDGIAVLTKTFFEVDVLYEVGIILGDELPEVIGLLWAHKKAHRHGGQHNAHNDGDAVLQDEEAYSFPCLSHKRSAKLKKYQGGEKRIGLRRKSPSQHFL